MPLVRGIVHWPEPPAGAARRQAVAALWELRDWTVPCVMAREVAGSTREPALDDRTRDAFVALSTADGPASAAGVLELLLTMLPGKGGSAPRIETMLGWLAPHAPEALIAGFEHPRCREAVARVSGALRLASATPALLACLEDERPEVRAAAAGALGRLGSSGAVAELVRCAADDDRRVRSEAISALNGIGKLPAWREFPVPCKNARAPAVERI